MKATGMWDWRVLLFTFVAIAASVAIWKPPLPMWLPPTLIRMAALLEEIRFQGNNRFLDIIALSVLKCAFQCYILWPVIDWRPFDVVPHSRPPSSCHHARQHR
jgi:hypothetical protein